MNVVRMSRFWAFNTAQKKTFSIKDMIWYRFGHIY